MTRFEGIIGGLRRLAPQVDHAVEGVPFLGSSDVKELVGATPSSLLSTKAAKAARLDLPDGDAAWPMSVVRERAEAKGLDLTALDAIAPTGPSRYVDLETAGARHPQLDEQGFIDALHDRSIPSVLVQPVTGGDLLRMVPEGALPAPVAAAEDAVSGAASTAKSSATASAGAPADKGTRSSFVLGLKLGGAAVGAMTLYSVAKHVIGGHDAPAASAPAPAPPKQPASSPASAPSSKPAKPTPAPAAPSSAPTKATPSASPTHTTSPAEQRRAKRAAKIVSVAQHEVGVKQMYDAKGNIIGRVKKYFSSSTQARATVDWDWPGYFVAWAREQAGAPVAPANHDWKYIDDLVAESKRDGTWKGAGHEPQAGDVVFYTQGAANKAAIVTGVKGGRMQLVQGWVSKGIDRVVAHTTLKLDDARIRGYATVPS
jgi:hypothetical protein